MILEFKVKNFRSIKEEVVFSMVAESSQAKNFNVFEHTLPKGEVIRLLNTAVFYGPNASGKSNIFKAMFDFLRFLKNPPEIDKANPNYDPFSFDRGMFGEDTLMELSFIGPDGIKFVYGFQYNLSEVTEEYLYYYPDGNRKKCFHRQSSVENELVRTVSLGSAFGNKKLEVFSNQLLLSKFGRDTPHDFFTKVFVHVQNYRVVNACAPAHLTAIQKGIEEDIYNSLDIREKLNSLMRNADFKLEGIEIKALEEEDYKFPEDFPNEKKAEIIQKNKFQLHGIHKEYEGGFEVGTKRLAFKDESQGTRTSFILGGLLFNALNSGSTVFVDELDTSLHPDLTRALVGLFQSKTSNPKNAQLIFTTHDTNLLDSDLFRKDQIWFTAKDDLGVTELFSLQDFDAVREDTAFKKWYDAGKFGAKPVVRNIFESLSDNG